jgi:hypothetical protein
MWPNRIASFVAALACTVTQHTTVVAAEHKAVTAPQTIGTVDTSWMTKAKYGIFVHYQHRILLGYCIRTQPQFPQPAEMTAEHWNQFVDGFDVKGFANQMSQGRVGWVIFCVDDHYFAWP